LALRHQTKGGIAARTGKPPVDQAPSWFETPWHSVTLGYGSHQMSLLVETDDEEEARMDAQEICAGFDGPATVLFVTKVVLQ